MYFLHVLPQSLGIGWILSTVATRHLASLLLGLFVLGSNHTITLRTRVDSCARNHGEIIYGGTRRIGDDCYATFSEYIFLFPAC